LDHVILSAAKGPGIYSKKEGILCESAQGRSIRRLIDGVKTKDPETDAETKWRKDFLRKIRYEL